MGDPLLRHIRHAEDWLARARLDWRRGNAPAAMLRLMLAEAEIRHARETGAASPAVRAGLSQDEGSRVGRAGARRGPGDRQAAAGWPRAAAAIAAAAVLAAGLGYASMRTGPARHDALAVRDGTAGLGGGLSRTIVRLDSGEFLMPDRARTGAGFDDMFAGRSNFMVAGSEADGRPADPGSAGRGGRPLQFAVPVDLKTPSPTF